MRTTALTGCLAAIARTLLVGLLALTTSWTLFETFLANLDARSTVTSLVAEAGANFLTPHLVDQGFVKAGYQDAEKQAVAQPNGSVYFPFILVPIPAKELAGKSTAGGLDVLYTHLAAAYYDRSGFDGIIGVTPPQAQQNAPLISKVCSQVSAASNAGANATLPPGVDVTAFLAALAGQSGTSQSGSGSPSGSGSQGNGNGSGQPNPAQAQHLFKVAQIVCGSIQRGNGLTTAELNAIVSNLSMTSVSGQSNGSGGSGASNAPSVPSLPDLSRIPLLSFFGLTAPLSANAERASSDRQHIGLGIAAILALLLVLLSRGWGRLVHVAVGVLLGGATGLAVLGAASFFWSRNAAQLQPFATLLHAVENQFAPPYVTATIAGALGILVAIGGTIAMKVMAARSEVRSAQGSGESTDPALVAVTSRTAPPMLASASAEPMAPTVYSKLPVEPAGESMDSLAPAEKPGFPPNDQFAPTPPAHPASADDATQPAKTE